MDGSIPRIQWKAELNFGHVLTALTMAATVIFVYANMAADNRVNLEARAKYIPIIEQNDEMVKLQKERIDRLADSVSDLRSMTVDMTSSLRESNESLAQEHRLSYGKMLERMNEIALTVTRLETSFAMQRSEYPVPMPPAQKR